MLFLRTIQDQDPWVFVWTYLKVKMINTPFYWLITSKDCLSISWSSWLALQVPSINHQVPSIHFQGLARVSNWVDSLFKWIDSLLKGIDELDGHWNYFQEIDSDRLFGWLITRKTTLSTSWSSWLALQVPSTHCQGLETHLKGLERVSNWIDSFLKWIDSLLKGIDELDGHWNCFQKSTEVN